MISQFACLKILPHDNPDFIPLKTLPAQRGLYLTNANNTTFFLIG